MTTAPAPQRMELLLRSEIELQGRIVSASNVTCRVALGGTAAAVYKPVAGTRPLSDFRAETLAAREVAAYLVSQAGGWELVPETVLRDGPLGPGSLQWWIESERDPGDDLVDVLAPAELLPGWLPVVRAEDQHGAPVLVAHAGRADLVGLAVLDIVLNNADRKAAHVVLDAEDRLWAFDHGLCLHEEDKLRTVLWGWHGQAVPEPELARLARLDEALLPGAALQEELARLVTARELAALRRRVRRLLDRPVMPSPPTGRYPLPWPLW